jgi:hypothetical protein
MAIWYAVPTMKQPGDWSSLPKWRQRGYRLAVFQDQGRPPLDADLHIFDYYRGYADAVNRLCRLVLEQDRSAQVVITGGDDIDPDPVVLPDFVEEQMLAHFQGSFGVMQPCGDRWMENEDGACACERVLESPWMGREWIERINGGQGPIWPEYFHFFEDEEHFEVAKQMGRLWLRRDLIQYHHHWSREGRPRPKYLFTARACWDEGLALFRRRREAGFPGHAPLAREECCAVAGSLPASEVSTQPISGEL